MPDPVTQAAFAAPPDGSRNSHQRSIRVEIRMAPCVKSASHVDLTAARASRCNRGHSMLFSRKGAKSGSKPPAAPAAPAGLPGKDAPQAWYGWAPSPVTPTSEVTKLDQDRPPRQQKILIQPGESVIGLLPQAEIRPAQSAIAEILVTPSQPKASNLRVLLIRNGQGSSPEENFKAFFRLDSEKVVLRVGGKFSFGHPSLRLEIKNVGDTPAEFIAERPILTLS